MDTFPHITQVVLLGEFPQWAVPHNQETGGRLEFLKAFQFPQQNKENPELTEPVPWEDPQAFLALFEHVAKACQWPTEEWAARLLPALSGEAKTSFTELETRDREDYGKVKAAILQGDAVKMEEQRQRFRQFRYQQAEDPQQIYHQLQELCCQWLKPERHTKEQILELLILEQFLAILPQEIQNWMKDSRTNGCFPARTLVEDFLSSHQKVEEWKSQGATDVKCVTVSLDEAEQTALDPSHGPMYWEVLKEDSGNVDFSGGVLIPKLDDFPELGQEEIQFIQILEDRETFPGSLSGDEETNKSREVLPQQGRNKLKEVHQKKYTPEVTQSQVVVIREEKGASEGPQAKETAPTQTQTQTQTEFIRLSDGHVSLRETTKHMWVKRLLYSQGGRTCPSPQSGLAMQKMPPKGKKLYPCPTCGKAFTQKNVLEDHQCVHTGNKLYECPSCGKKFRWRRWVVEHQRIHTGEKPYTCSTCGKSFRWRAGLRSHWKIHLRQSSYESSCQKSYR